MDSAPPTRHGRIQRPRPRLADTIRLSLPNLPSQLVGRRVLHLSDLHIRRTRPYYRRIIEMCSRIDADIIFLTGDYMNFPGDEPAAIRIMSELTEVLRAKSDVIYATFGNHDYPALRRDIAHVIPDVAWICNGAVFDDAFNITIIGTSTPCDLVEGMAEARRMERKRGFDPDDPEARPYRILLGHEPTVVISAADLGIEWTLAGHTHGGQMRLAPTTALHTSCDLPPRFASGILRLRDSICTVNRGLGNTFFDIRLFCPPQILIYELERGPLPGGELTDTGSFEQLTCVRWW